MAGAGALTLGAGGILAACGSGGGGTTAGASQAAQTIAAGSKSGKIHNLVLLSNDWNTVMTDAASRAAAYLGLDYSESNFNQEESTALNQAQQAIAAGADMVMTQAADGSSIPALGRLAAQHGVYMSNMETNAPWFSPIESGDNFMWFFCPADWIGFYETTKVMLKPTEEAVGPDAKVLHISGLPGSRRSTRSGPTRRRKRWPSSRTMQLLGTLPGEWSAEGGQKATEALVSRYGNPDAIISQNDGQLTGVLAACRSLGLEAGKNVLLCGCDGTTDILEATAAGQVFSTNFASPAYFGIASVVRVFDGLNGFQPSPLERQLAFPGVVTTKANASGLLNRYVENDNLPFDPKLMSRTLSKDNWDPMVGFQVLDVDNYWKEAGVAKPSGYENPAAYTKGFEGPISLQRSRTSGSTLRCCTSTTMRSVPRPAQHPGIDLCLHLIRKDHGSDVANAVARLCVVPPSRSGGQAQYIERPVPDVRDTSTQPQAWALQHLESPLTLADLAALANMSVRSFTRKFRQETGVSATEWINQSRVERARHLLESSDLSIDEVAQRSGFGTSVSLRNHLRAAAGVSPSDYRRTFHPAAPPPPSRSTSAMT